MGVRAGECRFNGRRASWVLANSEQGLRRGEGAEGRGRNRMGGGRCDPLLSRRRRRGRGAKVNGQEFIRVTFALCVKNGRRAGAPNRGGSGRFRSSPCPNKRQGGRGRIKRAAGNWITRRRALSAFSSSSRGYGRGRGQEPAKEGRMRLCFITPSRADTGSRRRIKRPSGAASAPPRRTR